MDETKLVISLIRDNLIHVRLIKGLENLGLDANNYHLHLSETIFELIGISNEQEELFENYLNWCELITGIEIFKYPELLDNYTDRMYWELIKNVKPK